LPCGHASSSYQAPLGSARAPAADAREACDAASWVGFAYEVKWDGFRAIVSTVNGLRVRSRRGWDMTHAVPELERLPAGLILDGELIALGDDGLPSFPRVSERCSMATTESASATSSPTCLPAVGRPSWRTLTPSADDSRGARARRPRLLHRGELRRRGGCLCRGCTAGARGDRCEAFAGTYRPGERLWLKVKNRDYWRFGQERELAKNGGSRTFV